MSDLTGLLHDRPQTWEVPENITYLATDESNGTEYINQSSVWVFVASDLNTPPAPPVPSPFGGPWTGADIVDDSLTGDDIQDESLTSYDVQDGTLLGDDLEGGTITSLQIQDGTVAPGDLSKPYGVIDEDNNWTGNQVFYGNAIATNGKLIGSLGNLDTDIAFAVGVQPEPGARYGVTNGGKIVAGDGTNPPDTDLQRDAAGIWRTGGLIRVDGTPTDPTDLATVQYVADNAGTDLLPLNNTWTGTNDFGLEVTVEGVLNIAPAAPNSGQIDFGGVGNTKISRLFAGFLLMPSFKSPGVQSVGGIITRPVVGSPGDSALRLEADDQAHEYMNLRGDSLNCGPGSTNPDTYLQRTGVAKWTANGGLGLFGVTPPAQAGAIADAAGGVVIDVEARAALNSLLAAVRAATGIGLIA